MESVAGLPRRSSSRNELLGSGRANLVESGERGNVPHYEARKPPRRQARRFPAGEFQTPKLLCTYVPSYGTLPETRLPQREEKGRRKVILLPGGQVICLRSPSPGNPYLSPRLPWHLDRC